MVQGMSLIIGQIDDDKAFLIVIALIALGVAFVIWIISAGVRAGMTKTRQDNLPGRRTGQLDALADNGPGLFKVTGVDRASKMDTTWNVEAMSVANAKAKAELEGIVVTEVKRVR